MDLYMKCVLDCPLGTECDDETFCSGEKLVLAQGNPWIIQPVTVFSITILQIHKLLVSSVQSSPSATLMQSVTNLHTKHGVNTSTFVLNNTCWNH